MNIVEKILARGSGKSKVSPDDVVFAKVDKVMVHDVSGPGVLKVFDKLKNKEFQLTNYGIPPKSGLPKIILSLQQKKCPQKISLNYQTLQKTMELKNTSSMAWVSMVSVTLYLMKKQW